MPISNYPNGFNNGVSILGVPLLNMYGGDVYWVDSAGSTAGPGTFDKPYSTLQGAIDATTASNGDQVIIKAGHTETITGVGGLDLDTIGITVTGLGRGKSKPRFLMDGGTTVTLLASAADVTLRNVELAAGHASVATAIGVTATGATFEDVDFTDNTGSEMFVDIFNATGGDESATGLTIRRCHWRTEETTGIAFIDITGDISRLTISDCHINTDLSAVMMLVKQATAKDMRGTLIRDNYVSTANTDQVVSLTNNDTTTANSGFFIRNHMKHLDTTTAHLLFPAGGVLTNHDNRSTSVVTLQGLLLPVVDS